MAVLLVAVRARPFGDDRSQRVKSQEHKHHIQPNCSFLLIHAVSVAGFAGRAVVEPIESVCAVSTLAGFHP